MFLPQIQDFLQPEIRSTDRNQMLKFHSFVEGLHLQKISFTPPFVGPRCFWHSNEANWGLEGLTDFFFLKNPMGFTIFKLDNS